MPETKRFMGWGEDNETEEEIRLQEDKGFDILEEVGYLIEPATKRFNPLNNEYLNKVKEKHFQFDSGFCFYGVEKEFYGDILAPGPQVMGNCVGFSSCMCIAKRIAFELAVEGDVEQRFGTENTSFVPYIPYSQGAGKVYIGNRRVRGDGSYGSWQIAANQEYGFLPCNSEGLLGPFPQSTATIGRDFCKNRTELDKYKTQAQVFDQESSVRIKTFEEAKTAICEWYEPITIASTWGFIPSHFDTKYGIWIYKRTGRWPHQMQLEGIFEIKGAWFGLICNQWGIDAHKDIGRGFPLGRFVVTEETLNKWLKVAYAATIGELKLKSSWGPFPG